MKFDIYKREREKNYYISLLSFPFVPPLACRNTDNTQQNPNNHISTTDTENSVKNIIINDNFVKKLFEIYSDDNCLSNFLLFEKSVDFFSKFGIIKNDNDISLEDYFEIFINYGNFGLSIPFIKNDYNILHNIFNPTLSSIVLLIKSGKTCKNKIKINTGFFQNNITLTNLADDILRIEFNESNPYYFRETIESKLKLFNNFLGKKNLQLSDIIKKGSHFSILWTSTNHSIIETSFLSFYTFDFNYIGSLIIKRDDSQWLSCLNSCNNCNNIRDFKNEYMEKTKIIENYIQTYNKSSLNIKNKENISNKYFANDYLKYLAHKVEE